MVDKNKKILDKKVLIFACTQEIQEIKSEIKNYEKNWRSYSEAEYNSAHLRYRENCAKLILKQKALDKLITACTPMFEIP
jgi:hypothetical protein